MNDWGNVVLLSLAISVAVVASGVYLIFKLIGF